MSAVYPPASADFDGAGPAVPGDPAGRGSAVDRAYRAARDGDREAFARFYDLTAGAVHGVVLAVVRNPALAQEVTQEVYVELWRLAPRYDAERGGARGWALTVARRRAIDRVRAEQSGRDREERAGRLLATVDEVEPPDAGADTDRRVVVDALRSLSLAQRQALVLAYYGGWTHRDVAEILDIPVGTAKTRIRDGLRKLRDVLGVERGERDDRRHGEGGR